MLPYQIEMILERDVLKVIEIKTVSAELSSYQAQITNDFQAQ
jgi:hypothetical protein